jgi:hypothetical protein
MCCRRGYNRHLHRQEVLPGHQHRVIHNPCNTSHVPRCNTADIRRTLSQTVAPVVLNHNPASPQPARAPEALKTTKEQGDVDLGNGVTARVDRLGRISATVRLKSEEANGNAVKLAFSGKVGADKFEQSGLNVELNNVSANVNYNNGTLRAWESKDAQGDLFHLSAAGNVDRITIVVGEKKFELSREGILKAQDKGLEKPGENRAKPSSNVAEATTETTASSKVSNETKATTTAETSTSTSVEVKTETEPTSPPKVHNAVSPPKPYEAPPTKPGESIKDVAKSIFNALTINETNTKLSALGTERLAPTNTKSKLNNVSEAGQIIQEARKNGTFKKLSDVFLKEHGQNLSDYIYSQTKKAGLPREAIHILETPRIAHGLEAIYREADGWTTNRTLRDILNGFSAPELQRIEKLWNDVCPSKFQFMLKDELDSGDAEKFIAKINNSRTDIGSSFEPAVEAKALFEALQTNSLQPSGTIRKFHDQKAISRIFSLAHESGKLAELELEFSKIHENSTLHQYVSEQARSVFLTKTVTATEIRWLEGDRVANGVEAIYNEAAQLTTAATLIDLLEIYKDELPRIRDAWNRSDYQSRYGTSFDEMLDYELSGHPDKKNFYKTLFGNQAALEAHIKPNNPPQTSHLSVIEARSAPKFNLERNEHGDKGLISPVGICSENAGTKYWSIIRTLRIDNEYKPALLQVVSKYNTDFEKAVISAYELLTDENQKTITFRKRRYFDTPVTLSETKYSSAEIRTDGSVLLFPADPKDSLIILKPNKKEDSSISWEPLPVTLNRDTGEVTRDKKLAPIPTTIRAPKLKTFVTL